MKISVVVPVYNVKDFLPECLGSIAAAAKRTSAEVECLAVDDGSTDGSGDWLDAAARHAPELRVLRQPNAGVGAARNAGLAAASGDWILFADADDFVRDSWLESVRQAVAAHPDADLVAFGMQAHYGGEFAWKDALGEPTALNLADEIPDALVGFSICQFAYRASVVKGLRFRPLTLGEDLVFVAEALSRARSCVVLPRREYGYRYREGSATHSALTPRKLRDAVAFHEAMFTAFAASGKRLGPAFAEGRGRMWMEELPKEILPLRQTPEGRAVFEAWLDSMAVAAGLPFFAPARRARARRVAAARTAWSVLWNCRLPAWLRRKLRRR